MTGPEANGRACCGTQPNTRTRTSSCEISSSGGADSTNARRGLLVDSGDTEIALLSFGRHTRALKRCHVASDFGAFVHVELCKTDLVKILR